LGWQSVADAEVYVKDVELEIGDREQRVPLVGKPREIADLAEVRIISSPA